MPDYVKVRQSFLDVPVDDGFKSQHFVATENSIEIFNDDVAFNSTGVSDVVEFWVEIGSELGRSVTYSDGKNTTEPFSDTSTVEDLFAGPPATGFGGMKEIDQRTADTRPTD